MYASTYAVIAALFLILFALVVGDDFGFKRGAGKQKAASDAAWQRIIDASDEARRHHDNQVQTAFMHRDDRIAELEAELRAVGRATQP